MKSSGWVSRGDWSHASRHTLWDVKGPQQKQQLWLQGKTVKQNLEATNSVWEQNRRFCCVGLDGYASYGIQQPVQPTWTYPQNLGPPKIIHTSLSLSDNISSAFDNFSWISRAQHFWDKSPWLVSRPVRPGCAREMELRCLSPKTTKWNEFFFVTANLISWRIQSATWWT